MSRTVRISADTLARQRRAADPAASAWVEANAGSGKTYVLTRRVLRLLLSDVPPGAILCLTYTKAAAAEMRRRVAATLAQWALLDEAALSAEIDALDGAPTPKKLRLARTLFAHALETPGGLKIVTIHAFCESVLHRFPLEAGVPFDFSVIEDEDRAGMILGARESVLAGGLRGETGIAGPVGRLFALMTDSAITKAIDEALADGRKLRPVLADRGRAKARLRTWLGCGDGLSAEAVDARIVAERLVGPAEIARLFALCPPKPGGSQTEDKLGRLDLAAPDPQDWMAAFLTADQAVPKTFPKKAVKSGDPALAEMLVAEAERLADLAEMRKLALLLDRSDAILDVLGVIADSYEAQKRARSLLDFDDLIEKLGDLFANPAYGPWVQYKLDAGITHILVDESQDTNPEQWRVVREIAREFFVGDSAIERPRTLFAVGDQKQSIYSFQGAEPRLFGDAGREFQRHAERVDKPFERVPLHTSFRTLKGILEAVDLVCERPDIAAALLAEDKIVHETARPEAGGTVTLWPPVQQPDEGEEGAEWPLEASESLKSAPRQLAERIAAEIASWVAQRRPLGPRGRAVTPDDVLILVQVRSALFFELIRALNARGLPTPGADRLAVTSHIAVLDLLALGDVLLNPADDLQLAALLRSPLFDVDEDLLFALAHDRDGRLWDSLMQARAPQAQAAAAQLRDWRSYLDFGRPFEFFAQILYADGGLRRFQARLGGEVEDVLAQFLELAMGHEQTAQPSLEGFLAAMRASVVTIKRELAETGAGVRVMTVHGAKGLEAPIVILADAVSTPSAKHLGRDVHLCPEAPGPFLIHAAGRKDHVAKTLPVAEAQEERQRQEYWRKLYVAMTRAEDELYVTGAMTPARKAETQLKGSWYEAIEAALAPLSAPVHDAEGEVTGLVFPALRPLPAPITELAVPPKPVGAFIETGALLAPVRRETVRPSSAHEASDPHKALDTVEQSLGDADTARQRGVALHALLQHLGKLPRADWERVLDKALPALLPQRPELHAQLAQKAVALLEKPYPRDIFGPLSRAEVPILIDGLRGTSPVRIAGRIDRLVVTKDSVLVVDFKSDAAVPDGPEAVPPAYLTQLGLYALVARQLFPGWRVETAILWTSLESLMFLPEVLTSRAAAAFTLK